MPLSDMPLGRAGPGKQTTPAVYPLRSQIFPGIRFNKENKEKHMADSADWNNYAEKNRRLGWSDVNAEDRDWHAREQRRAEEQARLAREHAERQRLERQRREEE